VKNRTFSADFGLFSRAPGVNRAVTAPILLHQGSSDLKTVIFAQFRPKCTHIYGGLGRSIPTDIRVETLTTCIHLGPGADFGLFSAEGPKTRGSKSQKMSILAVKTWRNAFL
jgi:hypothetical protein